MTQIEEAYTYILPSNIDIGSIEKFHGDLKEILASKTNIILNFEKVILITTPGIQLIFSFIKYCRKNNLKISISNLSQEINNNISDFGLNNNFEQEE